MNFSTWAIKKPIPSILLFIFLTAIGIMSFKRIGIANFPDMDFPWVTVTVILPGASPNQLEVEVTRKVEDAVASLGLIENIKSTVSEGVSTTVINFKLEKNSADAVDEVRDAVASIRNSLPQDINEPLITRQTSSGGAILTYSIQSNRLDELDLSWFVDNVISKEILKVQGVSQFKRIGGLNREVAIELDPAKLRAMGITAADISSQLRNLRQDVSSGLAETIEGRQTIKTNAALTNIDELKNLQISIGQGASAKNIPLGSIAMIQDGPAERSQLVLFNGKPVVAFEIARLKSTSEVQVATDVRKKITEIQSRYPNEKFIEINNTTDKVLAAYHASIEVMLEGALLAIIVVFLFLRDWRATWISAVALPLSIIPTFWAMEMLNFTLNGISLLALALVVGILVDDAIVEIENIVRHMRMGKSPIQAAIDAAEEIGLAVIATTLTLAVIFLPTAFMPGIPGRFFKQFGLTAAVAVMFSLLVARLLTPMMAAYWLKVDPNTLHEHPDGRLMQWYLRIIQWTLKNRLLTMIMTLIFFVFSIKLIPLIPKTFFPIGEDGQVTVKLELPPGSTLQDTIAAERKARQAIQDIPEFATFFSAIGSNHESSGRATSGLASSDIRRAELIIKLKPDYLSSRNQKLIEAEVRNRLQNSLDGVRFSIGQGSPGEKFMINLLGNNGDLLRKTADAAVKELRTIQGIGGVSSSAALVSPEITIRPNYDLAANLGVTSASIGRTLRIATAGDFDQNLPKLNLPERQVPIRVKLNQASRHDINEIKQLQIPTKNGWIALENIADIQYGSGSAQITRYDREQSVTLTVELNGLALGDVSKKALSLPALAKLPSGIRIDNEGEAKRMGEVFAAFGSAMVMGLVMVYVVLVLLFHSFMQPITVLSALPLSIGGAMGLLLVTNTALSLPTLIGLIMLMGIVTKNSILLVDYAIMIRENGVNRLEAVIDACHKRAQPIIMTTIAMGLGMMPIALGWGADASFRSPMAIAVIGGLITSTVLSLLVIPVVYTLVDDLVQKFSGSKQPDISPSA